VDARDKNNRVEQFEVITTILEVSIDGEQIGELYEQRWEGEVDLRSIKSTMQMDVLRGKTPEMVHKEIWTHLLAYNLLRTVMAVAAHENDLKPRQVSFKGAKQAVTAFAERGRGNRWALGRDACWSAVEMTGNSKYRWPLLISVPVCVRGSGSA
jgi:Transposase DDE domain